MSKNVDDTAHKVRSVLCDTFEWIEADIVPIEHVYRLRKQHNMDGSPIIIKFFRFQDKSDILQLS